MVIHISQMLIQIGVIIFSIALHEFGHAAMADKLGDPTPKAQGRLTLNPLAHLDPLGTLFIIITTVSGFGLGWGKPVQTNPRYYRNYRQGLLLVALAGPAMNLCLVMFGLGVSYLVFRSGVLPPVSLLFFLRMWVLLNLILATFNLLPIPPLDGGNVLSALLPYEAAQRFRRFSMYGLVILLLLMASGMLNILFHFVIGAYTWLIGATLGPEFLQWFFPSMF